MTGKPKTSQHRPQFTGRIEPYTPNHLTQIQEFWVASWALTLPEIDFEARRPWFATHIAALLAAGTKIRVAVEHGEPCGFITVDPASGHLDQICVAPNWWGSGVAEALLRAARQISPDRLTLDVNADNPRAVRFYAREGFVETGRDVNPRSGLPIIRMTWSRG